MVLSHWILKEMGCGPQQCKFELLIGGTAYCSTILGVVTEEVRDFQTARQIGYTADKAQVPAQRDSLVSEGFLMTMVAHVCQFTRIPGNRDNWGYIRLQSQSQAEQPYTARSISIIDFSSYDYDRDVFGTKATFLKRWAGTIDSMLERCNIASRDDWQSSLERHWTNTIRISPGCRARQRFWRCCSEPVTRQQSGYTPLHCRQLHILRRKLSPSRPPLPRW